MNAVILKCPKNAFKSGEALDVLSILYKLEFMTMSLETVLEER